MPDVTQYITLKHLEYENQYNNKFRPITNKPIITVEISPTGSGKTYSYQDSANTIMLMPTATIKIIKSLDAKNIEAIKFTKLDISEYKDAIEKTCSSQQEVIKKVDELIEDISLSKDILEKEKKIITKKLQDIQKVEPFIEFEMDDKLYKYTDEIIVKQMIYSNILNKCKWHYHNLDKNIYKLMKGKIKSTERFP